MLKYNIITNKTYFLNFNAVYFFVHRHISMTNKCDITKKQELTKQSTLWSKNLSIIPSSSSTYKTNLLYLSQGYIQLFKFIHINTQYNDILPRSIYEFSLLCLTNFTHNL
jgi:hypothetical protein